MHRRIKNVKERSREDNHEQTGEENINNNNRNDDG